MSVSHSCKIYTIIGKLCSVDNSVIIAPGDTIRVSGAATSPGDVRVGATRLDGGPATAAGSVTLTCAGVYDENYAFSASTCP